MSQFKKILTYKFQGGPKLTFTDYEVRKHKGTPGVGKYDIDKCRNVLTLGARKSVYK